MVALARNLDFFRSRFLTGLTAVFLAWLRPAPAWKVCTFGLLSRRHRGSPFQKQKLHNCDRRQWRRSGAPRQKGVRQRTWTTN